MTDENHDEAEIDGDVELEADAVVADGLAEGAAVDAVHSDEGADVRSDEGADVVDDEDASLSSGGLAFVAFAMLVLVGGAVFVLGSLLSQSEQTAVAQVEAEAEIAEFDPDEFVSEFTELDQQAPEIDEVVIEPDTDSSTTIPESIPLADDDDAEPEIDPTVPLIDPEDTALVFVNRVPGDDYGHVGYVNLAGERFITPLTCQRVDWNRNGGICLQSGSIGVQARGLLLDSSLRPTGQFPVATPSRAEVSPDGTGASWTGFVTGHDYLAAGEFATTTQLIDVDRQLGADLETDFVAFLGDGTELEAFDDNYWGTSYVNSQQFYATVGFEGRADLVFGDVETGRLDIVFENASCPAISPDGSTIIAKEQRGNAFQLIAIDVATGSRRDLAETRSIDDQVEWIDDTSIVYGLLNEEAGTVGQPALDIWVLNVSDGSAPRLLLPFADSPAAA